MITAVVKAYSQSNRKGQISTPCGSETHERILIKVGIYNHMTTHAKIHVALRQRGWFGRTRDMSPVTFFSI